ncbi:MAG: zinc ribbon domain-containing protein [Gammaproteobacteria bacterium]|nr:MAG: zinc ribbon domain-containing protein [Gammaproteobacteria bacterium]
MPVYEYECQACKFYTEVMQKVTDTPLSRCPSCGKSSLKKLVSAPVFRLKGSGWYETDFKSDKEGKRNLVAAEKEEAAAVSKAEGAEGKPAAADAKEAKAAEGKSAEPKAGALKAAAPKAAAPKAAAQGATGSSRKRVSVPVKGARAATPRNSPRGSRTRRARGRRR